MKVLIINGSPKGKYSVTFHHTTFIQKKLTMHNYEDINVSANIKRLEKDYKAFEEIMNKIERADLIIWASPVYINLVPSQFKRFFELISERNYEQIFANKYFGIITTSILFHDHTAHNYMQAISEDLGMKLAGRYSAYSTNFEKEEEREKLIEFAKNLFHIAENKLPVNRRFQKLIYSDFEYSPSPVQNKVRTNKKVLVITDNINPNSNITKMIARFKDSFADEVEEINITTMNIKGGCLGCIRCSQDYICIYEGSNDEFNDFYRNKVMKADVVVMAGEMKDRYLSARWKMFSDRNFFHNHAPYLIKKHLIYLISGPLSQNQNMRQIFEAWSEAEQVASLNFISDEMTDSKTLDFRISSVAEQVVSLSKEYQITKSFLGVGGMKIFRDELYGPIRFPFTADYEYYKKHGLFDFEHNKIKYKISFYFMKFLMKIPKINDKMIKKEMKEQMIKPYKKIIEEMEND